MSLVPINGTSPTRTVKVTVALTRSLKSGETIALLKNGVLSGIVPAVIDPRTYIFPDTLDGTGNVTYKVRFTSPNPPPYESPGYKIYYDNPVLCAVKIYAEAVPPAPPAPTDPLDYPFLPDLFSAWDVIQTNGDPSTTINDNIWNNRLPDGASIDMIDN